MILHMYANYNRKACFFGSMIAENIEPDVLAKDYIQILCSYEPKVLEALKDCDLYYLGTYDNVSGVIKPVCEFLLHIDEVISLLEKKEVQDERKES